MKLETTGPFSGRRIYGPYLDNSNGRKYVRIVWNEDGSHYKTMSYARYLVSLEVGRELTKEETVDHVDGNYTNNNIDNLEIVSLSVNIKRAAKGKTFVTLICPECEAVFDREKRQTHLGKGKNYKGSPTACSRSCSVKLQHKRMKSAKNLPG